MTDALVGCLHQLGGEIRTTASVDRIEIAGGRVAGARIVGGERLGAHTVIADVTPHALLALAGDALPRAYAALLRRYRCGPATLKVDWALDGPIPWQPVEARSAGTVHVSGNEDAFRGAIAATRNRLAERAFLLLGHQSLADPSRAPEGKHTAWAYTHGPASTGPPELERHVARMESQVERFAPGFRELILARHVMHPATFERRDRNLVGGDVGGAAIGCARSCSGRCRGSRRTGPRSAASTWGAPRPSQEEPCMGYPATPPRAPRSATAELQRAPTLEVRARPAPRSAHRRRHLGAIRELCDASTGVIPRPDRAIAGGC